MTSCFSVAILVSALAVATATGSAKAAVETGPRSKIHRLAHFSTLKLVEVCAASNAMACTGLQGAEFEAVESATTQVVSGINYSIEARTSAGMLSLRMYEQEWTRTLEISSAAFASGAAESRAEVLTTPLALDVSEWKSFVAREEESAAAAAGDTVESAPSAEVNATKPSPIRTRMSAFLLGGVPMGNAATLGGHYTGDDASHLAAERQAGTSASAPADHGETRPPPHPLPETHISTILSSSAASPSRTELPPQIEFHDNHGAMLLKEHPQPSGALFALLGVGIAFLICAVAGCFYRLLCRAPEADEVKLTAGMRESSSTARSAERELEEAKPADISSSKWEEE